MQIPQAILPSDLLPDVHHRRPFAVTLRRQTGGEQARNAREWPRGPQRNIS